MKHVPYLKWPALSLVLLVILIFLGLFYNPETEGTGLAEIVGSVEYRERSMLPPNALVTISLEDVSRMDVKAELIGSTRFAPQGGPPWDFVLPYDPGKLHDQGRYALRARIQAGDRLLFTSTEHIPAFDTEAGEPVRIMVYRVSEKNGPGASPPPKASLTDTYWKLTEIDGEPAELGVDGKEVHLIFVSEPSRVKGFSGCNNFTGSYEIQGGSIKFSQMASTMRACVNDMEQEQRFLLALAKTSRYSITGKTLEMQGESGESLLRFEAVYLQ